VSRLPASYPRPTVHPRRLTGSGCSAASIGSSFADRMLRLDRQGAEPQAALHQILGVED
jgi:hypothetical protein